MLLKYLKCGDWFVLEGDVFIAMIGILNIGDDSFCWNVSKRTPLILSPKQEVSNLDVEMSLNRAIMDDYVDNDGKRHCRPSDQYTANVRATDEDTTSTSEEFAEKCEALQTIMQIDNRIAELAIEKKELLNKLL